MKDSLGDRMKKNYEDRTRYYLPRRTYTIIRIDGKCFHTLTRKCEKPYDEKLMNLMDSVALNMCKEISGAKFAYVQSDEISILLTDFDTDETQAWFDGNLQKIASVSASMATMNFNRGNYVDGIKDCAMFDSRVFTISDSVEVENYFVWRQKDAMRNSLQMFAQSMYSHRELQGKKTQELLAMTRLKSFPSWEDISNLYKNGRLIRKFDGKWGVCVPPVFTENKEFLIDLIPPIRKNEG